MVRLLRRRSVDLRAATLPEIVPGRGDLGFAQVKAIIDRARAETIRALSSAFPTEWRRARLAGTLRRLDRALDDMAREFGVGLGVENQATSARAIGDVTDLATKFEAELGIANLPFDRAAVDAIVKVDAGLVTNMGTDAKRRLARRIQGAVLTGEGPEVLRRELARAMRLPIPDRREPFGPVQSRAETVWRTETLRVESEAAQTRMDQWEKKRPGLLKTWKAASDGNTRPTHVEAGRRYAIGGDPGPIPTDEPYIVGGERLMYPRDPSGAAGETINCRCSSRPYRPQWDDKSLPKDPIVGGRRKSRPKPVRAPRVSRDRPRRAKPARPTKARPKPVRRQPSAPLPILE